MIKYDKVPVPYLKEELKRYIEQGIQKAGNLNRLCRILELSIPSFYNFINKKKNKPISLEQKVLPHKKRMGYKPSFSDQTVVCIMYFQSLPDPFLPKFPAIFCPVPIYLPHLPSNQPV